MAGQSTSEILAVKRAVRQRDGYRCTQCGMTESQHQDVFGEDLGVWPIVPRADLVPSTCITLCKRCPGPRIRPA